MLLQLYQLLAPLLQLQSVLGVQYVIYVGGVPSVIGGSDNRSYVFSGCLSAGLDHG